MGISFVCGTGAPGCPELIDEIEKKIHETEPREDGTLDIEVIIKGKSESKITLAKQNAEELKSTMKFNFK